MDFGWILTRKANGSANVPLVIQGYQDRDLEALAIASPMASRRSRGNFLATAARQQWRLKKADMAANVA